MQARTRQEVYQSFIEFIQNEVQQERRLMNRRMLSVFLWCFLLPVVLSVLGILLVKIGVFPRTARKYLDGFVLVFPVLYSLYVLGAEVLAQVPSAFRRGGIVIALGQSFKEGQWRERVCEGMRRHLGENVKDLNWIIASFRIDLDAMKQRNKFVTALAGAVFYLLMHGIDALGDGNESTWVKTPMLGWVETSSGDMSQFVGLALFLVLLYLSGNQTYHSLYRYLNCAELLNLSESDLNH